MRYRAPLVKAHEYFRSIPAGSFIAFLADPYGGEAREDGRVLADVMVCIGEGRAVGSNNGVVDGRGDWSEKDLGTRPWTIVDVVRLLKYVCVPRTEAAHHGIGGEADHVVRAGVAGFHVRETS